MSAKLIFYTLMSTFFSFHNSKWSTPPIKRNLQIYKVLPFFFVFVTLPQCNSILPSRSKQALSKSSDGLCPDLSVSAVLFAIVIYLTTFPVNSHSRTGAWSYSTGLGKPVAAAGVQNGHWTGGLHLSSEETEGVAKLLVKMSPWIWHSSVLHLSCHPLTQQILSEHVCSRDPS